MNDDQILYILRRVYAEAKSLSSDGDLVNALKIDYITNDLNMIIWLREKELKEKEKQK